MGILGRYFLRRALSPVAIALVAIVATVLVLQLLRLGHHLLGSQLGVWQLLGIIALSLPTLLLFGLPVAAFCGLLFAVARLRDTNQLLAMRSLGLGGVQLALPAALLASLLGLSGAVASWYESAALMKLHGEASEQMARALVDGIEPGFFHRLLDDTVVYSHRRLPDGRLEGLVLARQGGSSLLLASTASITVRSVPLSLELDLSDVELQQRKANGELRRIQMASYHELFPLPIGSRHFGFLLDRADRAEQGPARELDALLVCMALGLLGTLLGTTSWRRPVLGATAAATLLAVLVTRSALAAPNTASIALSAILVLVSLLLLRRR